MRTRSEYTSRVGRMMLTKYKEHKAQVSDLAGRPTIHPPPAEVEPVSVCNIHLAILGKGQSATKGDNVEELVRSSSKYCKEVIVSSQLREVL